MVLKLVRLELAREKGHPEGDPREGYELIAPLDDLGRFSPDEWRKTRKSCTLRRFRAGHDDMHGMLIHTGSGGWAFSYDPLSDDDDEAVFRLDAHIFRPGEYVSVKEPAGPQHTFRVSKIQSV